MNIVAAVIAFIFGGVGIYDLIQYSAHFGFDFVEALSLYGTDPVEHVLTVLRFQAIACVFIIIAGFMIWNRKPYALIITMLVTSIIIAAIPSWYLKIELDHSSLVAIVDGVIAVLACWDIRRQRKRGQAEQSSQSNP